MFEGIDFFNQEKRCGNLGAARIKSYFNPGNVFLVHINKTQLRDSKYIRDKRESCSSLLV